MIEAKIEIIVSDAKCMSVIALKNMVHSSLIKWVKDNDSDLTVAQIKVVSIHPAQTASY